LALVVLAKLSAVQAARTVQTQFFHLLLQLVEVAVEQDRHTTHQRAVQVVAHNGKAHQ
jgi:hypothetical protein